MSITEEIRASASAIQPLGDRVLLRVVEQREEIKHGIVIPVVAKEKPQEATVVAVGPGRYSEGVLVPMGLDPGDRVIFTRYAGMEIRAGEESLLLARQDDIIAKINGGL